jgi:hypothetical protein
VTFLRTLFQHLEIQSFLNYGSSFISISLDQNLQDRVLHEVFDEIDDYITDEIHNYLKDLFNTDRGHQGWRKVAQSIVICEEDSEQLKDTKGLLKIHLGDCKLETIVCKISIKLVNTYYAYCIQYKLNLNQFNTVQQIKWERLCKRKLKQSHKDESLRWPKVFVPHRNKSNIIKSISCDAIFARLQELYQSLTNIKINTTNTNISQ